MISSELPEVMGMSDRIMVMGEGGSKENSGMVNILRMRYLHVRFGREGVCEQ